MTLNQTKASVSKLALAAAMISGTGLALPVAASANDELGLRTSVSAPIAVASCTQDANLIQTGLADLHAVSNSLNIGFINQASVPATDVEFRLRDGGATQSIHDRGTFAPGVTIRHEFARPAGSYVATPGNCSIVSVRFADGSSWRLSDGRAVVGVK